MTPDQELLDAVRDVAGQLARLARAAEALLRRREARG